MQHLCKYIPPWTHSHRQTIWQLKCYDSPLALDYALARKVTIIFLSYWLKTKTWLCLRNSCPILCNIEQERPASGFNRLIFIPRISLSSSCIGKISQTCWKQCSSCMSFTECIRKHRDVFSSLSNVAVPIQERQSFSYQSSTSPFWDGNNESEVSSGILVKGQDESVYSL